MPDSFYSRTFKCLAAALFFSGFTINAFPSIFQQTDSVYKRKNFTGDELVRGERLFYGLAYPADRSVNCTRCHNTVVSDTLNWNPDALQISLRFKDKGAYDLSRILLNPVARKMSEVHKGFQLTPEDIVLIKAYMDRFVSIGLKPVKPVITNLVLFILACILFLLSVTDLIILKRVRKKWILISLAGITFTYITWVLVVNAIRVGRTQYYSPDQPIKFSHGVHAGQNKIDCIYCHSFAHVSKVAGIPPVNVCMNCHLIVRSGSRSGTFEIAKIIDSQQSNVPIEWVKVHNLPDHVFFSHAQHTGAGKLECGECHGKVEEMHRIVQVSDLSMGWCINCHRTRKTNFRTNTFYTQYKEMSQKVSSGMTDTITISMLGGTECAKCHY